MKIAVMLRTLEEKQGVGIYARNLMSSILKIDKENEYYFLYATKNQMGSFGIQENLKETFIVSKNKLLWDQVFVYNFLRKNVIDIVFNTKFSVPLLANCKTAMVFHGSEWYVHPEFYSTPDILYNKIFLPLYCKKASAISSVSRVTADDMLKFIGFDSKKSFVVHSAIDPLFKPISDRNTLSTYRNKFNLPDKYMLFVGKIYPGKNFGNILRSFKIIKEQLDFPIKLVCVGDLRWKYEQDFRKIEELDLSDDVIFTGWVEQKDLPPLYQMAELFLFPSLYEGFGIPIVEAMACGCPVVTAKTGSCPEVAGSAARLVDPYEPDDIAGACIEVITNSSLRKSMRQRGYEEAKRFSWNKAARETIDILSFACNA